MEHIVQNSHHRLERRKALGLDDYIRTLYEACECRPYCNEADICRTLDELEAYLEDMEFRRQDRILSTVNVLCACFDYAGFSEGFRRGAELALELTDK